MERIVIKADRSRIWWSVIQSVVGLIAVGVYTLYRFPLWAALLGIAFVGIVLIRKTWVFANQLSEGSLIILDEEGITDRSYGLGFVPWSNIQGAELQQIPKKIVPQTVVALDLKDPDAYFENSDSLNSAFLKWGDRRFGGFWLNTSHVDCSSGELLELVRRYIEKYST